MLNAALVSHTQNIGGAETMLLNLARRLADRGNVNPTIMVPRSTEGNLARRLNKLDLEWRDAPPIRLHLLERTRASGEYASHVISTASEYAELYWRSRTDVVVINTLTNLEAAIGARLANLPYILWVHGVIDGGAIGQWERFKAFNEQIILSHAHEVVCCSKWTENYFRHLLPNSEITTIPNWTDVEYDLPRRALGKRICSVGALERHKGTHILIQAVAELKQRGVYVGIDIYGGGPLRRSLEELARSLGVSQNIVFHGWTANPATVYRSSYATIVPSLLESFGMVSIESMANRTPVIASRTGGLVDIIEDNHSGLLFEKGNAKDLADKISNLLEDPERARRIGEAGFLRVREKFDGTESSLRFEQIIAACKDGFQGYGEEFDFQIDALSILAERRCTGALGQPAADLHESYELLLAKHELSEIRASTSWKITAPIRMLGTAAPKFVRTLKFLTSKF